jgi:DNA-binding IclR family transcriptional regulator
MNIQENNTVSSMANALKLLNLFSMDEPEWTLSELAEKLNIGPSTVYRLTKTLLHEGFIMKDRVTKKFRLGSSLLQMGHYIISSYDICKLSPPIMEKLVQDTGETVHLSILEGNKTIYLQVFECQNYVNVYTHVGKTNPVHCTSTGQIILAYQPEVTIEKVIHAGLPLLTPNTITDPQKFRKRLAEIKKQGYTFNKDEMNMGVSAIAAPVKTTSSKVKFAVSIAGPNARINSCTAPSLSKLVVKAAEEISQKWR